MAFANGSLTRLSGANSTGGAVFIYTETATLASVRAPGYFNDAAAYGLVDGDVVMLICSNGFGFNLIIVSGAVYTVGEALTSS